MSQIALDTGARPAPLPRARLTWRRQQLLQRIVVTVLGLLIFIVLTFPFLWLLLTSVKTDVDSWAIPPQYIPLHPTLEKYQALLAGAAGAATTRELQYWYLYVLNSLYVAIIPAVLSTAIGTLAGYGFARFKFPGASTMLTLLLVGQMFPGPSLFVPIYFLVNQLGLQDSHTALLIIYTAFHVPAATWLASGFIRTIPRELEEAARIDGCTLFQTLLFIVIPLARIGIVTVAILAFMALWGEYGFASIILETQTKYTATIGLVRQMNELTTAFNTIGAAATMMGVPLLVVLMLIQRHFVRGLTAGAVKDV
ncbi:MAG: carbohydrate ABC transporter permease [Chloroflexi bacterium]|nr:carbohydrate ABC transporter permease [Chloroflexota bacterium]